MSDTDLRPGAARIVTRLAGLPAERLAFSAEDMLGRAMVAEMMAEAGLSVSVDDAFNVVGFAPGSSDQRPILLGSHLDSVPNPGRFDGALGVVAAVECAEVLLREEQLKHPLLVIGFSDEEGSITGGCWGARALTQQLTEAERTLLRDASSPLASTLTFAAAELRLHGWEVDPFAAPDLATIRPCCYVELHIEQGPVLERRGVPTGAVTSIVGIDRYAATFPGTSGHAGTVPMADRDGDVVVRSALFVSEYWDVVRSLGATAVVNFGDLAVHPGSFNVIPDEVRLSVEVRSPDAAVLEQMGERLESLCDRFEARLEPVSHDAPVLLDVHVREAIVESARCRGVGCLEMPSWAGHDAAVFAAVAPAGMIFVPSVGGASHCPREMTHERDIAMGLEVLADSVLRLDRLLP